MQDLLQALTWRYAVKVFNPDKRISEQELRTILESGRLAPSSYGLEPWKFIVVEQPDVRARLRAASYDQSKVTDASHLIVLARRTDTENLVEELIDRSAKMNGVAPESLTGLRQAAGMAVTGKNDADRAAWIRSQVYIPLGIMIETASLLGIDSCPMEGFNPTEVDAILGLPDQHLAATTMLALGYRGEDPMAGHAKVRRAFEDVVTFLR